MKMIYFLKHKLKVIKKKIFKLKINNQNKKILKINKLFKKINKSNFQTIYKIYIYNFKI